MTTKELEMIIKISEDTAAIKEMQRAMVSSLSDFRQESRDGDCKIIEHQELTDERVSVIETNPGYKIISWVFKSWQRAIVVIAVIVGTMGYAISWLSVNFGFKSIIEEAIKKIV